MILINIFPSATGGIRKQLKLGNRMMKLHSMTRAAVAASALLLAPGGIAYAQSSDAEILQRLESLTREIERLKAQLRETDAKVEATAEVAEAAPPPAGGAPRPAGRSIQPSRASPRSRSVM